METKFKAKDYQFLKENLISIGFQPKGEVNFKKDFRRLGLVDPRNLTGREAGFYFTENGLTVKVWTTYLEKEEKFRDVGEDMGWVLVTNGDNAVYFAKPIKRTESFLLNLLRKAWIAKWRVINRPLCKQCSAYMSVKQDHVGRCFWLCLNNTKHIQNKPEFLGWDLIGPDGKLPPTAKVYVEKMRKRIASYKRQNLKAGITRTPAKEIRKLWGITNPENKI